MEGGKPWCAQDVNPGTTVYTNLPSLAFVPGGQAMLGGNSPMKAVKCPYYDGFVRSGRSEHFNTVSSHATMRVVLPNRTNVEKSLAKCNVKPIYPDDEIQQYADYLVDAYMAPVLKQPTMSIDQHCEFNFQASPSKFWKMKGCKTKGDALKHPDFIRWVMSLEHLPLVDYCGKVEFLDLIDIIEELKIRGFFNPQFDFNAKLKILYENQNVMLLEMCDEMMIKYGFIKQYGGFNRLGKSLEVYDYHDEDDCKGYDRVINLIKTYGLRNRYLRYTVHQYGMLCYVLAFTLISCVICPDGIVRVRYTGNDSGRNNTSTDNSIGHLFILFRFICKLWLYYSKFKRFPSLEELLYHHKYCIYSDDALGAHRLEILGITPEDFVKCKTETYLEFGLEFKPKQHFHSIGAGRLDPRHSFLGSSFVWDEDVEQYIPYPRVEKLCSSLFYVEKKSSPEIIIVRTLAIMVLSAPVPWLYQEVSNYLDFLLETVPYSSALVPGELLLLVEQTRNNPKQWFVKTLGR